MKMPTIKQILVRKNGELAVIKVINKKRRQRSEHFIMDAYAQIATLGWFVVNVDDGPLEGQELWDVEDLDLDPKIWAKIRSLLEWAVKIFGPLASNRLANAIENRQRSDAISKNVAIDGWSERQSHPTVRKIVLEDWSGELPKKLLPVYEISPAETEPEFFERVKLKVFHSNRIWNAESLIDESSMLWILGPAFDGEAG